MGAPRRRQTEPRQWLRGEFGEAGQGQGYVGTLLPTFLNERTRAKVRTGVNVITATSRLSKHARAARELKASGLDGPDVRIDTTDVVDGSVDEVTDGGLKRLVSLPEVAFTHRCRVRGRRGGGGGGRPRTTRASPNPTPPPALPACSRGRCISTASPTWNPTKAPLPAATRMSASS